MPTENIWGMDPQQFNDTMSAVSSLGAGIAGKGSAADYINQTQQGIVKRKNAILEQDRQQDIDAERGRSAMRLENQLSGEGDTPEVPTTSELAQPDSFTDQLMTLSDQITAGDTAGNEQVFTPPGERGVTSFARGKNGEINLTYNPETIEENTLGPKAIDTVQKRVRQKKTASQDMQYKDLLMQQAQNSIATGTPTVVNIGGQKFTLSPAKAADLTIGAPKLAAETTRAQNLAEQSALSMTDDGGLITAGDLGAHTLSEAKTPTQIKVAQAAMDNPALRKELIAQKRAGATNLGSLVENEQARKQVARRSEFKKPAYLSEVQKNFDETMQGMKLSSEMRSKDPIKAANASDQYQAKIKQTVERDLVNEYGVVTKVPDKATGNYWYVYRDENNQVKPIMQVPR